MWRYLLCVQLLCASASPARLDLVYEWNRLDIQFPSPEVRQRVIEEDNFRPDEIYIDGLVVYEDKLIVNIYPTHRTPVTLAYINRTDSSTKSPVLLPYPSWEAHAGERGPRQVYKAAAVRVDRCHRLWVLEGSRGLLVFDLTTDTLLRRHLVPDLVNYYYVEVDDSSCDDAYAFFGEHRGGVRTYSWARDRSWLNEGDRRTDVYAMILTPSSEHVALYTRWASSEVFAISTDLRREPGLRTASTGRYANLARAVLDRERDVLYCNNATDSDVIHSIPCWRRARCDAAGEEVRAVNDEAFDLFPATLDARGYLWALARRKVQSFYYAEVNMKVYVGRVANKTRERT